MHHRIFAALRALHTWQVLRTHDDDFRPLHSTQSITATRISYPYQRGCPLPESHPRRVLAMCLRPIFGRCGNFTTKATFSLQATVATDSPTKSGDGLTLRFAGTAFRPISTYYHQAPPLGVGNLPPGRPSSRM